MYGSVIGTYILKFKISLTEPALRTTSVDLNAFENAEEKRRVDVVNQ